MRVIFAKILPMALVTAVAVASPALAGGNLETFDITHRQPSPIPTTDPTATIANSTHDEILADLDSVRREAASFVSHPPMSKASAGTAGMV